MIGIQLIQHGGRQATGFRSEYQHITGLELSLKNTLPPFSCQRKHPLIGQGSTTRRPVRMHPYLREFGVIEPGAAHRLVADVKSERLDQMQTASAVGGKTDHVAGIGWDFRLKEDDVEHDMRLKMSA